MPKPGGEPRDPRLRRRHAALVVLLITLAVSCGASAPAPLPTAPSSVRGVPSSPFEPTQAEPTRKARLRESFAALDAHFAAKLQETRATGFVAGIVLGGELVYARGFGVRDVTSQAAMDVDTVFRIASTTKSFTAAAILQLRDEGRVQLDAPAASYLPELAALRLPTADSPPITIRHLLTHGSGLAWDDAWGAVTFGMTADETKRLLETGATFADAPGERYAYSNFGYALLGRIVAQVSGRSFRDYVGRNILRPLKMTASGWEAREIPPDKLAVGYRRAGDQLIPEPLPSDGAFDAAGGLYTSMRDYARYVAFQLDAYPPRNDEERGPLRRSTRREMHQGQRGARWDGEPIARLTKDGAVKLAAKTYGFGWQNITTCKHEGIVQHGGYEPGYFTTTHLLPQQGLGIVTMAATESVGWTALRGTLEILERAGVAVERPSPERAEITQARQLFVELLQSWDAAKLAAAFDPQSLGYAWMKTWPTDLAELGRKHGPCQPHGPVAMLSWGHGRAWLECQSGALELRIYLTPAVPTRIQYLTWTSHQNLPAAAPAAPICLTE